MSTREALTRSLGRHTKDQLIWILLRGVHGNTVVDAYLQTSR